MQPPCPPHPHNTMTLHSGPRPTHPKGTPTKSSAPHSCAGNNFCGALKRRFPPCTATNTPTWRLCRRRCCLHHTTPLHPATHSLAEPNSCNMACMTATASLSPPTAHTLAPLPPCLSLNADHAPAGPNISPSAGARGLSRWAAVLAVLGPTVVLLLLLLLPTLTRLGCHHQ